MEVMRGDARDTGNAEDVGWGLVYVIMEGRGIDGVWVQGVRWRV